MSTPAVHHEHHHISHRTADSKGPGVKVVDESTIHISAKAMNITWGGDERFWRWIQIHESRFQEAAELLQVCWLEAKGTLDTAEHKLSPSTQYEIVYVIDFKDDAFGWEDVPVTFHLTTADGKRHERSFELVPSSGEWKHIHGGEFTTGPDGTSGKLHFGMTEVVNGGWKGGMILDGVIIRPKLVT